MSERRAPRLAGGIHRDVSGRADESVQFFLSVDRGLASGKLDTVPLDEKDLLRLIEEAAAALRLIDRGRRA